MSDRLLGTAKIKNVLNESVAFALGIILGIGQSNLPAACASSV